MSWRERIRYHNRAAGCLTDIAGAAALRVVSR
jgi:hypothetical protein